MAHDTHFLERLHRVEQGQAERALGLYRDPELVRAVLARAGIGEQAERVAIALEEGPQSPHIIVSRDGHFVTCLGPGMSTGAWPRVTRAQLDGTTLKTEQQRAARELLEGIKDRSRRDLNRLFWKLWDRASEISREDIEPLLAMSPILAAAHQGEAMRTLTYVIRDVAVLAPLKRSAASMRDDLMLVWNRHHLIGHLSLLAAAGADHLADAEAAKLDDAQTKLFAIACSVGSLMPQAARLLWALGRRGHRNLPELKKLHTGSFGPLILLPVNAALITVGLGHSKHRGEIRKLLERGMLRGVDDLGSQAARGEEMFQELWTGLLDDGANPWEHRKKEILAGWDEAADLDNDTLMLGQLNVPIEVFKDLEGYMVLLPTLHWIARARPEQFYLPEVSVQRPEHAFTLERGMALLETLKGSAILQPDEPVRVGPKVGRNEPCPCGSGRKSKKCCGDAARTAARGSP